MTSDKERYELGVAAHKRLIEGGRYNNAGYAVVKPDGRSSFYHRACNAELNGNHSGAVVITNSVQYNSTYGGARGWNKEKATKWYDYLFNRSAWSVAYLSKDPDVDKLIKEGIHVTTDVPANLAAAACIHTRAAWEKVYILDTFFKLRSEGLKEDRAFLSAFVIKFFNGQWFPFTQAAHCGVWTISMDQTAMKNYLTSKVPENGNKYNEKTFEEVGGYCGAPQMWNDKFYERHRDRMNWNLGDTLLDASGINISSRLQQIDPFNVFPELVDMTQERKEDTLVNKLNTTFEELGG